MKAISQTQIQGVSEWIAGLRWEEIPGSIILLAKLQVLDCLAAICAGARSSAGIKLKNALKFAGSEGPCTILPSGEKWSLDHALYYHTAMINCLELDNFIFMGHVGQSAFSVPLSLGELSGISGRDFLLALVTSEEVAGRLGAYLVSGPHQGHMRAFLHRVGSAAAASKIMGSDAETTSHALAIALSMPEFPLYPACFSPDTKVICTSPPTVEGVKAAFMAREGLEGPLDIIENPVGFFAYFSYTDKIPDIWRWVGNTWVLYTLSVKNNATCAYAQGPVTAALQILRDHDFSPAEIEHVRVYAPIVTLIMEKFSKPHFGASLTPVNTNFSTIRSVSAALNFGELTGSFYENGNFEKKTGVIEEFSHKIKLFHDWEMSMDLLKGIDAGLENPGKPGFLSLGSSKKTFKRFRKAFGSRPLFTIRDILDFPGIPWSDQIYFYKRSWQSIMASFEKGKRSRDPEGFFSHEGDLRNMAFRLSGRVEITFKNKRKLEGYCQLPPGFTDDEERERVIIQKYLRETTPVWGEEKALRLMNITLKLESHQLSDLFKEINDKM